MKDKSELFQRGKKVSIVAGLGTLMFALAKGIVGLVSGSIVLMGDAVHSGADSFSAFLVWAGLKISQKDPTEKFPYGYYKVENITSLLVSFLILFAGYSIITNSFNKLFTQTELGIPAIAVGVAVADALVMYMIGKYEISEGEKINSQSLIADGKESKMHIFSSSIVIVGLVATVMRVPYLEGVAGMLISLFIFQAGLESAKDSIYALMDVSPDKDIENDVRMVLNRISGAESISDLRLRKAGPLVFGEVGVEVKKYVDVARAHEIADEIGEKIKKEVTEIDSFTVHVEPYKGHKDKVAIPVKNKKGLKSKVMKHLGRANYFLLVDVEKGKIDSHHVRKNPYKDKKVRAGISAVKMLTKEGISTLITKEVGEISFHALRDNLIDVYKAKGRKGNTVMDRYLEDKLKRLKEPTKEKD